MIGRTVRTRDGVEFVVAVERQAQDESDAQWLEDATGEVGAYSDEVEVVEPQA
jgi:hypothetical protein